MTASETWKRKKNLKSKKQKQMRYICHAYSVWDCDGHGDRKTVSKSFEATDEGWHKAEGWMHKYADMGWNVSLVNTRGEK